MYFLLLQKSSSCDLLPQIQEGLVGNIDKRLNVQMLEYLIRYGEYEETLKYSDINKL